MALQQVPNPLYLEWQDWVDVLVGFNPTLRNTVNPDDPWREFAQRLTEVEQTAPRPEGHNDWQSWASALKLVFPG